MKSEDQEDLARLLGYLIGRGRDGATFYEITNELGYSYFRYVLPRLVDAGHVADVRPTPNGEVVWVAGRCLRPEKQFKALKPPRKPSAKRRAPTPLPRRNA